LPTDTDDEVAADTLGPVHGEGAGVDVGAEGTQVAVVVLDVVDTARAGALDLFSCLISNLVFVWGDTTWWSSYQYRAGSLLELRDRGSDSKGSNGCDGSEELHVEEDWNGMIGGVSVDWSAGLELE